ncbi:hypothetical protein QQX98_010523 [Neonectria punicea]|uniref:Phosphoglycerate mutase n=1 Tax=Neonectria punicea TaxID=979145 RepID=A0ABR1GP83_9HYPO
MSDQEALTPRVFLMRHGETEWAKLGRYTGTTDIELTPVGIQQVTSAAAKLVGVGKLLDPSRIVHVFVSPRKRAMQTFELLQLPAVEGEREATEDIAEWDYGDYEGLKTVEIRQLRKQRGLDQERGWDIWRDGCEGGESARQVSERLDRLISQIREIQGPCMNGEKPVDVLLRWLGFSLDFPLQMVLAPGAMTVLSYKNNNVSEPAIHVGIALPSADEDIPAS